MALDELAHDRPARISGIAWYQLASDVAKRLRALGVDEGAALTVIHRGVFRTRDPLALRLGNMTIAARRSHALAIEVELIDGALNVSAA